MREEIAGPEAAEVSFLVAPRTNEGVDVQSLVPVQQLLSYPVSLVPIGEYAALVLVLFPHTAPLPIGEYAGSVFVSSPHTAVVAIG